MLNLLKAGTTLMTRDPDRLSNAVYVRKQDNKHVVVSDFGNELILDDDEIIIAYKLSQEVNFIYSLGFNLDGYFPSLRERWQKQVELLTHQLDQLK